jgi:hypothetical protein
MAHTGVSNTRTPAKPRAQPPHTTVPLKAKKQPHTAPPSANQPHTTALPPAKNPRPAAQPSDTLKAASVRAHSVTTDSVPADLADFTAAGGDCNLLEDCKRALILSLFRVARSRSPLNAS